MLKRFMDMPLRDFFGVLLLIVILTLTVVTMTGCDDSPTTPCTIQEQAFMVAPGVLGFEARTHITARQAQGWTCELADLDGNSPFVDGGTELYICTICAADNVSTLPFTEG